MTSVTLALRLTLMSAALACAACQPVQPWERGDLAKPQMALDPNPTHSTLRSHTFASREAAQGGNAGVGGGCGCN